MASTHIATMNSVIVAVVRASICGTSWDRASPYADIVATAASTPAGTAKRRTRSTKPGTARRSLGARAMKKAGMPMVRLEMIVRCRGRNGNGQCSTPTDRASRVA